MSKPIYLKFDTSEGIVTIPFKSMQDVDLFTVMYLDSNSLFNGLIEILGLKLDNVTLFNTYLTDDKYKRSIDEKCYSVKYRGDNFNVESLKNAFVTYLYNDFNRILSTDIRYVKIEPIVNYFGTGMIRRHELEMAVNRFFAPGTGYKRKRDTYFLLKQVIENIDQNDKGNPDANIRIIIDKVDLGVSDKASEMDLTKYSMGEDDHLNNLIELSIRNPELCDRIMDEIAQSDLEDIKRYLKSGIVDGSSDLVQLMEREIMLLEQATGLSIDELRTKCGVLGRKSRSRR